MGTSGSPQCRKRARFLMADFLSMGGEDDLSGEELDALLISLVQGRDSMESPCTASPESSDSEATIPSNIQPVRVAVTGFGSAALPSLQPKKRVLPASDDHPPAFDEESRKARKMARNRRAAANSRARKKEQLDTLMDIVEQLERDKAELQADKAKLQAENDELRRNLGSTLKNETCDFHLDERPISIRQPEVLPRTIHSPLLEYNQPFILMMILQYLALFLALSMGALVCSSVNSASFDASTADVSVGSHARGESSGPKTRPMRHDTCTASSHGTRMLRA